MTASADHIRQPHPRGPARVPAPAGNSTTARFALAAVLALLGTLALMLLDAAPGWAAPGASGVSALRPAPYDPGRLIVGYRPPVASVTADIRDAGGPVVAAAGPDPAASVPVPSSAALPAGGAGAPPASESVVTLPRGESPVAAADAIRRLPGIAYAVPDYIAHAAGDWFPNDPGRGHTPEGWERVQWNFLAAAGVDAPGAWGNLIADHRPGGRGVIVAVLDTGVAFRKWHRFKRSPDLAGTRFVAPCDLISGKLVRGRCSDRFPVDRNGHGTFVAGMIAEATNNGIGLTGLAYGASIMPVRVLDASGNGDSSTIAAGIRYAVAHGARIINLSLEFYIGITPADIPDIMAAIRYAHARGVVVVAASGNDEARQIAYPARAPAVISVGATTRDRCLAAYSDIGAGLDLVAPGGGPDSASVPDDPDCHPGRNLPDVYQMTFNDPARHNSFSLPGGWFGTSMAAPAVSATAALVIASGVLGSHPTPDRILSRLESTATPVGGTTPNEYYGYGLLNAAAATAPETTTTPTTTTPTTTTTTTPTSTTAAGAVG